MTLFQNFKIDNDLVDVLEKKNIHIPEYNIFDDNNAFKFEENSCINDNLIPVLEYKITVNKESLHCHQIEWKQLFSAHYEKTLSGPPNWGSILLDLYIRMGILDKFKEYLISPNIKLQREALEQDE